MSGCKKFQQVQKIQFLFLKFFSSLSFSNLLFKHWTFLQLMKLNFLTQKQTSAQLMEPHDLIQVLTSPLGHWRSKVKSTLTFFMKVFKVVCWWSFHFKFPDTERRSLISSEMRPVSLSVHVSVHVSYLQQRLRPQGCWSGSDGAPPPGRQTAWTSSSPLKCRLTECLVEQQKHCREDCAETRHWLKNPPLIQPSVFRNTLEKDRGLQGRKFTSSQVDSLHVY